MSETRVLHYWCCIDLRSRDPRVVALSEGVTPGYPVGNQVYFDEPTPHLNMQVKRIGISEFCETRQAARDALTEHLLQRNARAQESIDIANEALALIHADRLAGA
jgi:hypothetical protein